MTFAVRFAALSVAAVVSLAPAVLAQEQLNHPVGQFAGYPLDTGKLDNPTDAARPAYAQVIRVKDAAWVRLYFSEASLSPGSYVAVTSMLDGEVQLLDADRMKMWSDSTAYFNGDSVLLEVYAGPRTQGNRLVMQTLAMEPVVAGGGRGGSGQCGICGADDRTPSTEAWSGRLMPVGCTASIFCEDSTLVSAGHCISGQLVMQFNVPASTTGCNTVNPPVEDQFPVTSTMQQNGGVGADWSVLATGLNNLNQTAYQHQNAVRHITTTLANPGQAAQMFGYGLDTTCTRSQTQQVSNGSIAARNAATYTFNNDVRGGNSGSGYIVNDRIVGVVTHCNFVCTNIATRHDLAAFVTARNTMSLCDNTYAVSVQSTGTGGVPIGVTPADTAGASNGLTNFSRNYTHFTHVTFTAPESFNGACFVQWTVNGAPVTGPSVSFTVTGAATVVAQYADCSCACDWNENGALNSQDFFDFLGAFFNNTADFNQDSTTNSQDFFDFLSCFFAGC